MYFNDIHIIYYLLIGLTGGVIGQFIDYCNKMFLEDKKILSKRNFTEYKEKFQIRYVFIIITAILYVALLYKFNITLDLLRFAILIPMLISAFVVDFKIQIIPNRLNLTIFEFGLIFAFIFGISNLNITKDMLLGMLTGGGAFLLITLIGGLIAGKEAMGLGDVKLMGALGIYFGFISIINISVTSFLIGAIASIIILIIRRGKGSSYIPFGPFIVISSIISIFIPADILFKLLLKIFSLGLF